jgi:release factor glutamine methyltransferase
MVRENHLLSLRILQIEDTTHHSRLTTHDSPLTTHDYIVSLPMTIQEARQQLTEELKTIYEEREASNISEWVMESLTGTKKSDRIVHKDKLLTNEQVLLMEQYSKRLLLHEPVQYVLKEAWFCGLKFYVDPHVLIPRPETEELVEWIISNCKFPIDTLTILDIGTGSGCIPITLKRKLRKSEVWTCDISLEARKLAKQNASALGADIHFLHLDFLNKDQQKELASFDIIVSNPPYIPEKDKQQLLPNVLHYEPARALFVPDNDPLIFYAAIADFGKDHLNKNGTIYLEIPENAGEAITRLFESKAYFTEIKKDMQGKERMVRVKSR